MNFPECTYTGGYVQDSGCIYLSAVSDELAEEKIDHAVIIKIQDGRATYRTYPNAFACFLQSEAVDIVRFVSIEGCVYDINDSSKKYLEIDSSIDGPSHLVHIKSSATIDGFHYVAGMARRVYVSRANENLWNAFDGNLFVSRENREEPIGILDIDGFGSDSVYACGLNGEIHYYDGSQWVSEDKITNVALTKIVCCNDSGLVYIAGQKGTFLKGKTGEWEALELSEYDFWGMNIFHNKLYLSSYDGVFVHDDNDVRKVKIPNNISTAYLSSSQKMLMSIGHKNISTCKDGENWIELEVEVSGEF